MANKSKLQNLPLTGELNLNINKLDLEAPATPKYNENNAPIYGNVLSPVYKKATVYSADYYDKNENRYFVSYLGLSRNGTRVIDTSHNPLIQTASLDLKNIEDYKDGDYIQSFGSYFTWVGKNTTYSSIGVSVILKYRIIEKAKYLVAFAVNTSNNYEVLLFHYDSENQTVQLLQRQAINPLNVGAPIFTDYKYAENRHLISLVTDSGISTVGNSYTYFLSTYSGVALFPVTMECTNEPTGNIVTDIEYDLNDVIFGWSTTDSTLNKDFYTDFLCEEEYQFIESQGYFDAFSEEFEVYPYFNYQVSVNNEPGTPLSAFLNNHQIYEPAKYDYYVYGAKGTQRRINEKHTLQHDDNAVKGQTLNEMKENANIKNERTYCELGAASKKPSLDRVSGFLYAADVEVKKQNGTLFIDLSQRAYGVLTFRCQAKNNIPFVINDEEITDLSIIYIPYNRIGYASTLPSQGLTESALGLYYFSPSQNKYVQFDGRFAKRKTVNMSYSTNIVCDTILDNGTIVCLKTPELESDGETLVSSLYGLSGSFVSFNEQTNILSFLYLSNASVLLGTSSGADNYPATFKNQVFSLSKDWFRSSLLVNGTKKDSDGNTKTLQLFYDSGLDKSLINPGYNTSTFTTGKGSIASHPSRYGYWRVLYNNGYISGISHSLVENRIGTLLTEWNTIQEVLDVQPEYIVYKDNYGELKKITLIPNEQTVPEYYVVLDKYIVLNTAALPNAYDIEKGEAINWAPDYNNRFFEGTEVTLNLRPSTGVQKILDSETATVIDASAINANYEMSNSPLVGYCLPAEVLTNVYIDKLYKIAAEGSTETQYYRGLGETTASYETSYKNGVEFKNIIYEGAIYPDTLLYSPNLFTKFIKTYNQRDLVINEASNTAYPLQKYNGNIIIAFQLTNGLENAENIFVIQTLHYMISKGYIYEIYYNGDTIDQYQAIMPVEGLTYLGCLPTEALFWCQKDRSIYSFAGDAIMRRVYQWNEITEINKTWYSPATQELFISTDKGLICISNNYQYKINEDVSDIWFFDDHYKFKIAADGSTVDYDVRYDYLDDYEGSIELVTPFLGSPENQKIHFDCFYVRLLNNGLESGEFKIKSTTITDMGMESEEKTYTLDSSSFDEITDSVYLRFQQQFQTAVGTSYEIKSDYPIIQMTIGYAETAEIAQIAHINI